MEKLSRSLAGNRIRVHKHTPAPDKERKVACQAVARGHVARLRPKGLRRGSLHALRERRLVGPA